MPTYEFRCPDGTIIERIFKMSEVPDSIPSPDGDGVAVRIISGGADLIFKGSGFYITDYGKDGKRDQREKSGKSDSTKPETKSESKSDSTTSKTETKSEKPAATKSESKPSSGSSPKGTTE